MQHLEAPAKNMSKTKSGFRPGFDMRGILKSPQQVAQLESTGLNASRSYQSV